MKYEPISMTKQEAIQAMEAGETVTHFYFGKEEHISMKDGYIIDENGYQLDPVEFWKYRTANNFNSGWSIYKK